MIEINMDEEKLSEGTVISCTYNGGFIGQIVGVYTNEILGMSLYIVKLVNRCGKAWVNYPYSCTVISRSMFTVN